MPGGTPFSTIAASLVATRPQSAKTVLVWYHDHHGMVAAFGNTELGNYNYTVSNTKTTATTSALSVHGRCTSASFHFDSGSPHGGDATQAEGQDVQKDQKGVQTIVDSIADCSTHRLCRICRGYGCCLWRHCRDSHCAHQDHGEQGAAD
jgi:hypothetical protein